MGPLVHLHVQKRRRSGGRCPRPHGGWVQCCHLDVAGHPTHLQSHWGPRPSFQQLPPDPPSSELCTNSNEHCSQLALGGAVLSSIHLNFLTAGGGDRYPTSRVRKYRPRDSRDFVSPLLCPSSILCPPPAALVGDTMVIPHCLEEDAEAQRGGVTCPRMSGRGESGFKPQSVSQLLCSLPSPLGMAWRTPTHPSRPS